MRYVIIYPPTENDPKHAQNLRMKIKRYLDENEIQKSPATGIIEIPADDQTHLEVLKGLGAQVQPLQEDGTIE